MVLNYKSKRQGISNGIIIFHVFFNCLTSTRAQLSYLQIKWFFSNQHFFFWFFLQKKKIKRICKIKINSWKRFLTFSSHQQCYLMRFDHVACSLLFLLLLIIFQQNNQGKTQCLLLFLSLIFMQALHTAAVQCRNQQPLGTITNSRRDRRPPQPNSGDDLSSRSTCPYRYHVEEDRNRIPRFILQAECLHSECQDGGLNVCEPVQTQVMVLRRQNCIWKRSLATQTVACLCATRRTKK